MSLLKKQSNIEDKLKSKFSDAEINPSKSLWELIEQKIDNSPFENKLQNKLNNATVNPSDKVWLALENNLPSGKSKKKRIVFWFSIITLIGMMLSSMLYVDVLNSTKSTKTKLLNKFSNKAAATLNQTEKNKLEIKYKNTATSKQVANYNSRFKPAANNLTDVNAIADFTSKSKNIKNKNNVNVKNTVFINSTAISNQLQLNSNKPLLQQGTININADAQNKEINQPIQLPEPSAAKSQFASNSSNENNPPSIKPVLQQPDSVQITLKTANNPNAYTKPNEVLTKYGITVNIGYQITGVSIKLPQNTLYNLNKAYKLRQSLENASADWTGGFLLSYYQTEKIIISAGINITNIKQNLSYNLALPAGSTDTLRSLPVYAYMHPTDSITQGTTNSLENKYSYTEFPVQVNYSFNPQKYVSLEIYGGLSYALLTNVNVYTIDVNCIGLMQITDKEQFPKYRNIFMAFGGAGLVYKFNPTVQFGSTLFAKTGLNNMVNNNNWINEIPYMFGLNLFLRKRF